jgi:hypothetical protein
VIDIRLAFQTVRDAMTISPVSLQNLHLMSAMAFCLTYGPRSSSRCWDNGSNVSPCLLRFFFRHHVADARISDPVAETLTEIPEPSEASPRAGLFIRIQSAERHFGSGFPEALLLGRYYKIRQLSTAGKNESPSK